MALNRHVDSYAGPAILFDFKRLKFGALHEKDLLSLQSWTVRNERR
jgi:hypothetical protein